VSTNLNDFLGQNLVLLWLFIALLLGALELLRRDRTMAMLAVASLVAALTALVLVHAWYAQLFVFVVVAIIGEVVLRRRRHVRAAAKDAPTDSV